MWDEIASARMQGKVDATVLWVELRWVSPQDCPEPKRSGINQNQNQRDGACWGNKGTEVRLKMFWPCKEEEQKVSTRRPEETSKGDLLNKLRHKVNTCERKRWWRRMIDWDQSCERAAQRKRKKKTYLRANYFSWHKLSNNTFLVKIEVIWLWRLWVHLEGEGKNSIKKSCSADNKFKM